MCSGSRNSDEILFQRTLRGQIAVLFTGITDRGAPIDSNRVVNVNYFFYLLVSQNSVQNGSNIFSMLVCVLEMFLCIYTQQKKKTKKKKKERKKRNAYGKIYQFF